MARYKFEIEISTGYNDADENVWVLAQEFMQAVDGCGIQLNYLVLEKDGIRYPASRQALEVSIRSKKLQEAREINDEVRSLEYKLQEAKKRLEKLA